MRTERTTIVIEDVGGSFKRFMREAPKVMKAELKYAVGESAQGIQQQMRSRAEVGPDAPHIRDGITVEQRGQSAKIGYLEHAGDKAGPNNDATLAMVALFNEYTPDAQPFMRPALAVEAHEFLASVMDAIKRMDNKLSSSSARVPSSGGPGGGGLR